MVLGSLDDIRTGYAIVVIGLGAAGSSFARYISSNHSVLIIESKKLPRNKPCTGVVSKVLEDYFIENNVPGYVFESPKYLDVNYVDVDNGFSKIVKKDYFNTNRQKLDMWLSEVALKSENINVIEEANFIEFIKIDSKLIRIIFEKDNKLMSVICRYLVGCDGALSSIRKKLNPRDINYYIAIKQMCKLRKKVDIPLFIFDKTLTDYYNWIVPKGNYYEIGVGVSLEESRHKFDLFVQKMDSQFGVTLIGKPESAIVLRPKSINDICLGRENILLCGEAAGLITPSGAEGISFALLSGKFAALSINEGEDKVDKNYLKRCGVLFKRLEPKFVKSKIISDPNKRKQFFK
jgi:geranylgeranyl diphosphate/geranylgeranyl-bacteriochlorophyllide a reductase